MDTYLEAQLDALGDGTRREILDVLLIGSRSVADIASRFSISRPAISQHLKILKDAQLVTNRAEGNRRVYAINPRGFMSLRQYLDRFTSGKVRPPEEPEDTSWRNW